MKQQEVQLSISNHATRCSPVTWSHTYIYIYTTLDLESLYNDLRQTTYAFRQTTYGLLLVSHCKYLYLVPSPRYYRLFAKYIGDHFFSNAKVEVAAQTIIVMSSIGDMLHFSIFIVPGEVSCS